MIPDAVLIGPALGIVARVKTLSCLIDLSNNNIRREDGIEAVLKSRDVQ